MSLQLSKTDIVKMAKRAESLQTRAKHAMEKAGEVVHVVVRSAEVGAGALAFGTIDGRYGMPEIVGVPADLGFAAAAHVAAFVMDGSASPHLHAFADGALAYFAGNMGIKMGRAWKEKALRP